MNLEFIMKRKQMTHDKIVIDGIVYKLTPELVTENLQVNKLDEVHFPEMDYHLADKDMTWQEAVDYAKSLGPGWRLPTKKELQAYAPQLSRSGKEGVFWSAFSVSASTPYAWSVSLAYGNAYNDNKFNTRQVVCVRP